MEAVIDLCGSALIFAGGRYPAPARAARFIRGRGKPALTLAADSGLRAAEDYGAFFGFEVDALVGDCDSVPPADAARYRGHRRIAAPRDKDDPDTILALKAACARAEGAPLALIGGTGGRLDHTLALTAALGGPYAPGLWLTEEQAVYLLRAECGALELRGLGADDAVSIFPVQAGKLTAQGLRWDINRLDWAGGETRALPHSLSNRLAEAGGTARFLAERGVYAIMRPLQ